MIVLDHRLLSEEPLPDATLAVMELPLSADQRTVLRGRRRTACGREVLLQLPRERALAPGDRLTNSPRQVHVLVTAAPEELLRVQAATPLALLEAAYHLGNRHVALELHEHEPLLLNDSFPPATRNCRGLRLTRISGSFTPKAIACISH